MKKLIAKKPILYGGRTYTPGETVPAHDQRMVKAWISAETAEWQGDIAPAASAGDVSDHGLENEGWKVINALIDMGVVLIDQNGAFVGTESLADQLSAVFAAKESAKADETSSEETNTTDAESGAQKDQETITANLDAADLEKTMTREQLNKLADDMKLDISSCKSKKDVAELIASVPVEVSENNEGAQ